jgi:hypothetical protein
LRVWTTDRRMGSVGPVATGLALGWYRAGAGCLRKAEDAKFRMWDCDCEGCGLAVKTAVRMEDGKWNECWCSVLRKPRWNAAMLRLLIKLSCSMVR